MDVGGTLTKIVYFEAKRAENVKGDKSLEPVPSDQRDPKMIQRNSSDSLAQLDCPDHQAALEHFYTFMDNNRNYTHKSAVVVRDETLSLYSKFLDGKLHFLHFETRNMVDAIKYVSSAAPIENIRSIGCTGGGAHKFAGEFEEELEITFNKFDELECLVRGMHFALNNFQDECFTYRPEDAETMCPPPQTPRSTSSGSDETSGGDASPPDVAPTVAEAGAQNGARPSSLKVEPGSVGVQVPSPSPPRSHSQGHSVHSIAEEKASPQPAKSPGNKRDSKEYTKRVLLPFSSAQSGPAFPYLVVNIGAGVSILKVTGPGKAVRVSGTSLGGGEDFNYRTS